MIKPLFTFLIAILLFSSCEFGNKTTNPKLRDFTFEPVQGIRYEEVKRRFSDGLSFNQEGFMQSPSWIIEVVKEDSILAYSPQKKIMQGFHLHYDHGNVYNFAEEWFKVKHISKDSLVLQRVQVNARVIADDFRSDVNMTFYAQKYINEVLKKRAENLQKPTAADTLFIKKRSAAVNISNDSAFAATSPVVFKAKDQSSTVEKISTVDKLTGRGTAYDYMFPQYKIIINSAYKEFAHQFSAIINVKGEVTVKNIYGVMLGDVESKKKVVQTVADYYLKSRFEILCGSTLEIPHNSEVTITLIGKTTKTN